MRVHCTCKECKCQHCQECYADIQQQAYPDETPLTNMFGECWWSESARAKRKEALKECMSATVGISRR